MVPSVPRVAFVLGLLALGACRHAAELPPRVPAMEQPPAIEVSEPLPDAPTAPEPPRPLQPAVQIAPEPMTIAEPIQEPPPPPESTAPGAIVAVGHGVVIDGDVGAARRAAIDDALAGAIGQALGVNLISERAAENYALTQHRIEASAQGFIRHHEILEESLQGDVVRVVVAAVVARDRWEAEGLDRVRVAVDAPAADAARELRRLLRAQGVEVVDLDEPHELVLCASLDSAIVHTFGGRHVAESDGRLSVRRAADGARVVERASRVRGERSNRPEVALRSAEEAALAEASADLAAELTSRRERLARHRLLVRGTAGWRCRDALQRELEGLEGVARADVKTGDCGTAICEIEMSPQALRDFPRNLERLRGVQLRVDDTGPHRTLARFHPAG